ncbi:cytochrome P450 76A1-like, partial [Mangifera indica]|uniref:cytochrome P450 76A1-like n=1 Tax=Mangifera indica TaxID=29780 RepID=UPI001CFA25DB
TSSSTEWALSELLRSPETLNKAKAKLAQVVGPKGMVEESDIANLPYLQAVIKETLRLHPPVPLLLPRSAIEDTKFRGYHIPKDTQLLVNAWAIGRDPDVWNDPLPFKPERFLDSTVDYKGQHHESIPFGAGRRMCVGLPLGHRILHLTLGSLLNEFDWELCGNVSKESINMNDRLGVTIRKVEPLFALPKRLLE